MAKRASADKIMLNSVIESCNESAKGWIKNISDFLILHYEDFKEYLPAPLPCGEAGAEGPGVKVSDRREDSASCEPTGSFGLI
jgi:hypothetical protein